LFRQVPVVDAGFEAGVLLASTPRAFPAMTIHAEITRWGWGIDEACLAECCDTDSFAVFYERLQLASTILKPGTRIIFDKTPRYLTELPSCMAKSGVPFVVVFKDPRALVCSDWRKAGCPPFEPWFDAYSPDKIAYLRTHYAGYLHALGQSDRLVCRIRMEDLCLDTRRTCERLYAHVGFRFEPSYMLLKSVRYVNTRLGAVSAGVPFEYTALLEPALIARVVREFSMFENWFYA
jgi:hypothetical protein